MSSGGVSEARMSEDVISAVGKLHANMMVHTKVIAAESRLFVKSFEKTLSSTKSHMQEACSSVDKTSRSVVPGCKLEGVHLWNLDTEILQVTEACKTVAGLEAKYAETAAKDAEERSQANAKALQDHAAEQEARVAEIDAEADRTIAELQASSGEPGPLDATTQDPAEAHSGE